MIVVPNNLITESIVTNYTTPTPAHHRHRGVRRQLRFRLEERVEQVSP